MNHRTILQEISILDLPGLHVGHAQNTTAKTGVTVLLFDQGARVGIDISGGGPASRETPLANPETADNPVNAIVLSGGSAYGLSASEGVMRYLEEHRIGCPSGFANVPLVLQSCIYDLGIGDANIRPDAQMGYDACANAQIPCTDPSLLQGNVGAGIGATVGKICGMERADKSGIGIHAVSIGPLKIAAIVVLNALGDIFNPETGQKIAGLHNEDRSDYVDTRDILYQMFTPTDLFTGEEKSGNPVPLPSTNTTIGAIITNGNFSKAELCKLASMTRCAYARCINPVGTMADGDSIYAASIGKIDADINMVGTLAAEVMEKAIQKAVSI